MVRKVLRYSRFCQEGRTTAQTTLDLGLNYLTAACIAYDLLNTDTPASSEQVI